MFTLLPCTQRCMLLSDVVIYFCLCFPGQRRRSSRGRHSYTSAPYRGRQETDQSVQLQWPCITDLQQPTQGELRKSEMCWANHERLMMIRNPMTLFIIWMSPFVDLRTLYGIHVICVCCNKSAPPSLIKKTPCKATALMSHWWRS